MEEKIEQDVLAIIEKCASFQPGAPDINADIRHEFGVDSMTWIIIQSQLSGKFGIDEEIFNEMDLDVYSAKLISMYIIGKLPKSYRG